ncbi:uncharacterized protein LOC129005594 [Macrosteles quadrilineatus]|nr:uncharacterized protein LOC129005594 [Macrosteles quadrilineatus]
MAVLPLPPPSFSTRVETSPHIECQQNLKKTVENQPKKNQNRPPNRLTDDSPTPCTISKKHTCIRTKGPKNDFNTLAAMMCSLSSELTSIKCKIMELKEIIKEEKSSQESKGSQQGTYEDSDFDDDEVKEILKPFPLTSIESYNEYEKMLDSQPQLRKQLVTAFVSVARKTSYSRTTTSLLKTVLHENVISHFTWRGMNRASHDVSRKSFSSSTLCQLIQRAVKKIWRSTMSDLSKKVDNCMNAWFIQNQHRLKKAQLNGQ